MKLLSIKFLKPLLGCLVFMFLSNLFSRNSSRNIYESEYSIETSTLSGLISKRLDCFNEITMNHKLDRLKLDKTSLNDTRASKASSFPFLSPQNESWSKVNDKKTAFVFSAYLVDYKKIVVIGIISSNTKHHKQHYCQIWYQNITQQNMEMKEQLAEIITLPESHGLRYTAVLFRCMLSTSNEYPSHVSIVQEKCKKSEHLLRIRNVNHENDKPRNKHYLFTVCLMPLHLEYDSVYEIIEWVELNRILGAEKFNVYNYSSTSNVNQVLQYYMNQGLVEIIQWNLPLKVFDALSSNDIPDIHYFGQVAALHDCLYRNKRVSEYIVNLDLDEFIIPHGRYLQSWSDIIYEMQQEYNVYLFRNTFFKKEWDSLGLGIQNMSLVYKLQLVTLIKLQHEQKFYTPKVRSKYIAKTANVSSLKIHDVPGVRNEVVPIDIAFLHHYRDLKLEHNPIYEKVLDKTVPNKFGGILLKNVLQVKKDLDKLSY